MTARRPARVVDAHVHLWDPARTDWYPYLSGQQDIGMETKGMARRFDLATYRAEAEGWNVTHVVNVAAATGLHSIDETLELDRRGDAEGQPAAIVGGLPPADSVAASIELLDRQMAAPRFRGVRPMGANAGPLPAPEVLRALQERGLLFELMAHPHQLGEAAAGLVGHHGLVVVVEHTGWPRSTADEERALWLEGLRALADLGANVHCKLSGLAMPLGAMDADAFRPWIEPALELFGTDRCLFASNFPVDGMHGTLDQLWSTYAELAAGLDDADHEAVFAGNAERLYSL